MNQVQVQNVYYFQKWCKCLLDFVWFMLFLDCIRQWWLSVNSMWQIYSRRFLTLALMNCWWTPQSGLRRSISCTRRARESPSHASGPRTAWCSPHPYSNRRVGNLLNVLIWMFDNQAVKRFQEIHVLTIKMLVDYQFFSKVYGDMISIYTFMIRK